ncbi:MAG TPA: aldo/keto reductase [Desulfobacteria bacterium]|nr:aldo/keto reductase [Desulfobacteria bacterium]
MKKRFLGNTGISVTELCFGALPMGPLQANISVDTGAEIIRQALENGVNFIDTAEVYRTYPYIRKALDSFRGEVVIATKSHAESYEGMEKAILDALKELDRDYIDIFHLHAAKVTPKVFEDRAGAIECLKEYKKRGFIRAIGISTHAVDVVERAAEVEDIEVVFPIINKLGMGIVGGGIEDMLKAIKKVNDAGKGMYAMKALAGGHLINDLKDSFDFVRNLAGISSVAVGMVDLAELEINLRLFNDMEVTELTPVPKTTKRLLISRFCKGCGACVETCPNGALALENAQAVVDREKCLLCGYCNPVCPEFAIRLV